jgi:PIN domain nuclease of toxin-antitoxin system
VVAADTHTAFWLTHEREKLSKAALASLIEARNSGGIAIAGISLWEIAMLNKHGRIQIPAPLDVFLRHMEETFVVLPITGAIADQSMKFSSGYPNDPADKLIGATARIHGLSLVTKDSGIRKSGEVKCIW